MSDLIDRQAAIDAPEKFLKDCNPDHFAGHQKFIEFMDNAEIGSFGNWQFANGFNMGLTAAEVAIKDLPSAQPTADVVERSAYDQVRWERDIAIAQLAEIGKGFGEQMDDVVERNKWIPVSERLPEEDVNVLVTVHFKGLSQKHKTGWTDSIPENYYVEVANQTDGEWTSYSDEYKVARNRHEVVAWMPLPEPWKGEAE